MYVFFFQKVAIFFPQSWNIFSIFKMKQINIIKAFIKKRKMERMKRSTSVYITRLSQPTSRLKQCWKLLTAIWCPSWERIPGSVSISRVKFQISVSGAPTYTLRPRTDIIISMHVQKCSSGFNFLQCYLFHLKSHGISLDPKGLARDSRIPRSTFFLI